jgi:hypothetical protein
MMAARPGEGTAGVFKLNYFIWSYLEYIGVCKSGHMVECVLFRL